MTQLRDGGVAKALGRARLEAIMATLECVGHRVGRDFGAPYIRFLVVQRGQRLKAMDQPRCVICRGSRDGDADAVRATRRGVMLGDHLLHASLRIAAGSSEVRARVVDLVLVEGRLRLREIEAVGERLCRRRRCLRELRRELGDLRLVRGQAALRLLQLRVDLLCFGREHALLIRRLSHGLRERQIHLLVGVAQRVLGEAGVRRPSSACGRVARP